MMEAIAAVAAFLLGWFLTRRRQRPSPHETMLALRHAGRGEVAYRDPSGEIACTLDELGEKLRTANLAAEPHDGELHVVRGEERVRLVVPEPRRVTLASLDVFQRGCETLGYELALALVPAFGPITLVDAMFGSYLVDGSRTAAELVDERAARIRAIASAIADDMAEKLRVHSGGGVQS